MSINRALHLVQGTYSASCHTHRRQTACILTVQQHPTRRHALRALPPSLFSTPSACSWSRHIDSYIDKLRIQTAIPHHTTRHRMYHIQNHTPQRSLSPRASSLPDYRYLSGTSEWGAIPRRKSFCTHLVAYIPRYPDHPKPHSASQAKTQAQKRAGPRSEEFLSVGDRD